MLLLACLSFFMLDDFLLMFIGLENFNKMNSECRCRLSTICSVTLSHFGKLSLVILKEFLILWFNMVRIILQTKLGHMDIWNSILYFCPSVLGNIKMCIKSLVQTTNNSLCFLSFLFYSSLLEMISIALLT